MITRDGINCGDRTGIRVAQGGNLLPGICCSIQRHDCIIATRRTRGMVPVLRTGTMDKKTLWWDRS